MAVGTRALRGDVVRDAARERRTRTAARGGIQLRRRARWRVVRADGRPDDATYFVDVEYSERPAVVDTEGAAGEGAPLVHERYERNTTKLLEELLWFARLLKRARHQQA